MNPWKITYNTFVPEKEILREALCTLGNGYFGTRGAAPETAAGRVHYPGTYIAGVYNELVTEIAGKKIVNEDFVNCPNWLMFNYRIGKGPWFDRLKVKILSWRKELNMKRGVLVRRIRWQDNQGRITLVESERIVSMADPHYGAMRYTIIPENYSAKITVRCGLDGQIINDNVERYRQLNSRHLETHSVGTMGKDGVYLRMQTNQSEIQITEAQRTFFYRNQKKITPKFRVNKHGKIRIIQEFSFQAKKGTRYTIEKIVSIYTSRDQGVIDHCQAAQDAVNKIGSFQELYKPHQARWRALWKRFDILVEGDDFVQQAIRFHTFHLLQVASTYNEEIDAGLPARGLHGEAYRGHIFWDEMFVYPFYNLHAPEITRSLLMYRYRRLKAAKKNARKSGYKGAMYPWQSASKGNETSQVIHLNPMSGKWGPDYSEIQRHISIAVAYNVWTYYTTSGDIDFLNHYGAEMIFEIAHFWSSLAEYNKKIKRYEIKGVMGPDEFHEKYPGADKGGLNNNAYTNFMAVWVIEKAMDLMEILEEEEKNALLIKAGIDEQEISRWQDIIKNMKIPVEKDGLIQQFDGYIKLKELDWEEYRRKYDNIHRIDRILKAEGLSPDEYKASKQADVLMIYYLLNDHEIRRIFRRLGYRMTKNMFKKNYDYYLERTSHGSTLSRIVHGYLAERLDYRKQAMAFFKDALGSDLHDIQGGTTQEGIHTGVMGGTIDIFLRCFAGISFEQDRLYLEPKLPRHWKHIRFQIRYRNMWFHVEIKNKEVTLLSEPLEEAALPMPDKIEIVVQGKEYKLMAGKKTRIKLKYSAKTKH